MRNRSSLGRYLPPPGKATPAVTRSVATNPRPSSAECYISTMPPNRRSFFRRLLLTSTVAAEQTGAVGPERGIADPESRRQRALEIRQQAARSQSEIPSSPHFNNGDEGAYSNRIASYSKGLPHNQLGEVDGHPARRFVLRGVLLEVPLPVTCQRVRREVVARAKFSRSRPEQWGDFNRY